MNQKGDPTPGAPATDFDQLRRGMVERQIRGRGVSDPRVLEAMLEVPRHLFIPLGSRAAAYADEPVAIGEGQTISQPYIVAAMTEALELTGTERVLEIGAGSGYQAAVLSRLASEVIAVESKPLLAKTARDRLAQLGYERVRVVVGDGTLGWPESAPYDAILVAAAAPLVPPSLIEQLSEGGRLVIPIGSPEHQDLRRYRKKNGQIVLQSLFACRFVPLVGRYAWPDASRS